MAVADGSLTRLGYITEATIGTTPTTPAFQIMRYVSADIKPVKETDIPDEIRADGNVASIVDVARSAAGSVETFLSYGTYDDWFASLFRGAWASNVLKNGITPSGGTFEFTHEQGATDSFVRFAGMRANTLDLTLEAKKSVTANWGFLGLTAPAGANTIISGATYTAATITPVLNSALNVAALSITGMTNAPKVQKLALKITSNLYSNDVVAQANPYSHGLGRFEVSGSMTTLFENIDTYNAILNHDDIAISVTVGASTGNKYTFALPKVKLMDGGPQVAGNGSAVMLDVPIQAYYDSSSACTMSITRAVA